MAERVVPIDLGVSWEPNFPEAVLITSDSGTTVLALRPHLDDLDRRNVVLVWRGAWAASMSPPNDEAIAQHRLYGLGLSAVLWIGVVEESRLVRSLEGMSAAGAARGLVHHVLLLKECVVEVVAPHLVVERPAGTSTLAAACHVAGR